MVTADRRYERIRNNTADARRIVESLVPARRARSAVMAFIAQTIALAHRLSPASWGISLFPTRVRLNVGRGAVLSLCKNGALLIVTGRQLKKVPRADRARLDFNQLYSFVPDAHEGYLEASRFHRLPPFARAHADLVERAARNRRTCFWHYAHSPSVVRLLREVGHSVPDPDYSDSSVEGSVGDPNDDAEYFAFEGRRSLRVHRGIERRNELSRRKKEKVLKQHGRLACEVCGFDFEHTYGSIGRMFAEVHHLVPLESLRERSNVSTAELAIVCANCHRMLHLGDPVFAVAELRQRISAASRLNA